MYSLHPDTQLNIEMWFSVISNRHIMVIIYGLLCFNLNAASRKEIDPIMLFV